MSLIECKNLSLGYGSLVVQENLNLTIEKGDSVYILGENGSGKSTLVKTILGFIKPLNGTITYSTQWNKKGIGYLPQTSEIQKTFPATVYEIVLSGCQAELGFLPFYKKQHHQKVLKNLELLGMSDYANKSFKVVNMNYFKKWIQSPQVVV